jgi:hypothetical protein
LEVLHKLMTFLEHGKPKRRGPAATKVAARDIKAAVLREVDGLTNRQIAEVLCINTPADFPIKGDHSSVRKMVGRGRSALVAAFGEEGWLKALKRGEYAYRKPRRPEVLQQVHSSGSGAA